MKTRGRKQVSVLLLDDRPCSRFKRKIHRKRWMSNESCIMQVNLETVSQSENWRSLLDQGLLLGLGKVPSTACVIAN